MQLFLNNWAAQLTAEVGPEAAQLFVAPAQAALLDGLGGDSYYIATLVDYDGLGNEVAWEIVRVVGANAGTGELTLAAGGRGLEGTGSRLWGIESRIELRASAGSLSALQRAGVQSLIIAAMGRATAVEVGTGLETVRAPYPMQLMDVRAHLAVAQTSGSVLTVDITVAGSSILATPLTIDNGSRTSVGAAAPAIISDTHIADDAEIGIDVVQVGNGTAEGLKVTLIGRAL